MHEVILSFGSNLGNRYENLEKALYLVNQLPGTKIKKISKIYETSPVNTPDIQKFYLNCCAVAETEYEPHIFLGFCLGIETSLGRKRPYKNAPRIIDIDLIMYDRICIKTKNLTVPHTSWKDRKFVLQPLCDLYEDRQSGKENLNHLLNKLEKQHTRLFDEGGTRLLERINAAI